MFAWGDDVERSSYEDSEAFEEVRKGLFEDSHIFNRGSS